MQADARSPEHGQYGFLQDLVRHVAYETLSKHERRARHLAAAEHLRTTFPDEDEIAEVIAAHYVDAYEANPEADDAAEVREQAREALVRAGERAESLAAAGRGAALPRAGRRSDRRPARAGGAARPGRVGSATTPPTWTAAARLLGESVSLYEAEGDTHAAARVSSRLAIRRALAGALRRGARADGACLRGDRRRRAGRGSRAARRQLGRCIRLRR